MKFLIIGKKGSCIETIVETINLPNVICGSPLVLSHNYKHEADTKIVYIKIPFYLHWDTVMSPNHQSGIMRKVFEDEIILFREAENIADLTIEYNGTMLDDVIIQISDYVRRCE